jgi:hypothetical protein
VTTSRATVVFSQRSMPTAEDAQRWLTAATLEDLEALLSAALEVVVRAVRFQRLAAGDAFIPEPGREHALVARVGYGHGDQLADGRWSEAEEIPAAAPGRRRRASALNPQQRLANLLGARERPLACEELAQRARQDLNAGRMPEAALQVSAALHAAVTELGSIDDQGLQRRVEELRVAQRRVVEVVPGLLSGAPGDNAEQTLGDAVRSLEAALRARTANRPET